MTQLPISEAARLVGKDRKTLYRHIKQGKLSATTDATGCHNIDVAELSRVYGAFKGVGGQNATPQPVAMPQVATPNATPFEAQKIAVLESENTQLRERLADKERHIEDMRNTVRLLEYKRQTLPKKKQEETPRWPLYAVGLIVLLLIIAVSLPLLAR